MLNACYAIGWGHLLDDAEKAPIGQAHNGRLLRHLQIGYSAMDGLPLLQISRWTTSRPAVAFRTRAAARWLHGA